MTQRLIIFLVCFFLATISVKSNPVVDPTKFENLQRLVELALKAEGPDKCLLDSNLRDDCESCSKVTKSVVVNTFCCKEKLGIKEWCMEFLNYALPESAQR
uniref:Venom protein n=1 Tax=Centruroides hentzi TaxID=88313 RepID=A0A2I9LPZ0_9SCOR